VPQETAVLVWPIVNTVLAAAALAVGGYVARRLGRVDAIWQELFGVEGAAPKNGLKAEVRSLGAKLEQLSQQVHLMAGNADESPAGREISKEIARVREDLSRVVAEQGRRIEELLGRGRP
jgi:hypothetical protein